MTAATEIITFDQTKTELEAIVADVGPDFTYSAPLSDEGNDTCLYVHVDEDNGELSGGCIVGVWLHRFHEISLERLHELEERDAREVISMLLVDSELPPIEDAAISLLKAAQAYQDSQHHTWASSVRMAVLEHTPHAVDDDDDDEDDEDPATGGDED